MDVYKARVRPQSEFLCRPVVNIKATARKEKTMQGRSLLLGGAILALISIYNPSRASAQDAKDKNCRMEQQCHWENFKKVCVWIKVCR